MSHNNDNCIFTLFENPIENQVNQQWLSTKEAADYLRLTPNALRIKVCRGQIRAYKLGTLLRFKKKDLNNILLCNGGYYD